MNDLYHYRPVEPPPPPPKEGEQVFLSNVSNLHAAQKPPPPPPPIVAVEIYRNDARLIRATQPANGGGTREKCTEISASAIKNAKHVIANSSPPLPSIITLTYPETFPHDGRTVKEHFRAMKERLRREYGPYDYFAAMEYQERGAPHLHIAISINLRDLGDITKLTRVDGKNPTRRPRAYETYKPAQDWLWRAWSDIIGQDGTEWHGITAHDHQMMHKAYFAHNSGVTWEVMRKEDGARRYLVKELSSLKEYQKSVPEDFQNPGRHFLYSTKMKPEPVVTMAIDGETVRQLLESFGWKWLPPENKPLFRDLWNVASELVTALLGLGVDVVDPDRLPYLRQYADVRAMEFTDFEVNAMAAWSAETRRQYEAHKWWEKREDTIERSIEWEWGDHGR